MFVCVLHPVYGDPCMVIGVIQDDDLGKTLLNLEQINAYAASH